MMGKTHAAVGVACAIFLTQPPDLKSLLLCSTAAYTGAIISDIDVTTSKSRKGLGKITAAVAAALILTFIAEKIFNIGISSYFRQSDSLFHAAVGAAMLLTVCFFGEKQPHRTFMHSFLAGMLLTLSVSAIIPEAGKYFAAAFLSHIVLDLLNEKNVQLLYPSKKLCFCFSLCKAGKLFDKILFFAGTAAVFIEYILFLLQKTSIL